MEGEEEAGRRGYEKLCLEDNAFPVALGNHRKVSYMQYHGKLQFTESYP